MYPGAHLTLRLSPWVWAFGLVAPLLAALFVITVPKQTEGVMRINSALMYQSGRLDTARVVELPHNLDQQQGEWHEGVSYEVELPLNALSAETTENRYGLLLPRVGTRFRVRLNGQEIYEFGWLRQLEETILSSASPHYVLIPTNLLETGGGVNRLVIDVQAQPLMRSGLWPLEIGDSRKVYQKSRLLDFMQVTTTWMVGLVSLLVGALSLIIWLLFRDRVFGLIFLAGVAHAGRSYFLGKVCITPAAA